MKQNAIWGQKRNLVLFQKMNIDTLLLLNFDDNVLSLSGQKKKTNLISGLAQEAHRRPPDLRLTSIAQWATDYSDVIIAGYLLFITMHDCCAESCSCVIINEPSQLHSLLSLSLSSTSQQHCTYVEMVSG